MPLYKNQFPKKGNRDDERSNKLRGILFKQHYPKDFLCPYGKAVTQTMATDTDIKRQIQPFTCEWLNRPGIAMSKTLETLEKNLGCIAKMHKLLKKNELITAYLPFQQKLIAGNFYAVIHINATQPPLLVSVLSEFKSDPSYSNLKMVRKVWCSPGNAGVQAVATAFHELAGGIYLPAIHLFVSNHCLDNLEKIAFKFANHEHANAFRSKASLRNYHALIEPTSLKKNKISISNIYHTVTFHATFHLSSSFFGVNQEQSVL